MLNCPSSWGCPSWDCPSWSCCPRIQREEFEERMRDGERARKRLPTLLERSDQERGTDKPSMNDDLPKEASIIGKCWTKQGHFIATISAANMTQDNGEVTALESIIDEVTALESIIDDLGSDTGDYDDYTGELPEDGKFTIDLGNDAGDDYTAELPNDGTLRCSDVDIWNEATPPTQQFTDGPLGQDRCCLNWSCCKESCFSFLRKRGKCCGFTSSAKERPQIPCSTSGSIVAESLNLHTQDTLVIEADPRQSLRTLVRLGKYAAAHRWLEQSEGDSGLSDMELERVLRVGAKFIEAERMFQMSPADLSINEKNEDLGLHWGIKLEGSTMWIVSVKEYDVDFFKMVALDLQRDWEDRVSEDDVAQEILGTPSPHDTTWRRKAVIKATGQKFDNLVRVNTVNALDETLNAVCSMKYTLSDSATVDPDGTVVPLVDSCFSQAPFVMHSTSFAPLALGGDKKRGVRKFECLETKLPPFWATVLGMTPGFLLKTFFRRSQETIAQRTLEVLGSPESDQLLRSPHNKEFIQQLYEELLGESTV